MYERGANDANWLQFALAIAEMRGEMYCHAYEAYLKESFRSPKSWEKLAKKAAALRYREKKLKGPITNLDEEGVSELARRVRIKVAMNEDRGKAYCRAYKAYLGNPTEGNKLEVDRCGVKLRDLIEELTDEDLREIRRKVKKRKN